MVNLFKKLPYSVALPLRYLYSLVPYRFRYGMVFWKTYNFLQKSQYWSKEKIEDYQIQQLIKIIEHVYKNVPYYRTLFNENSIKPKDIKSPDDLKKIPYLTKDLVRKNIKEMIDVSYPKSRLQFITTGGSTGEPLGFFQDRCYAEQREWAFILALWSRIGYEVSSKRAILRGNQIMGCSGRSLSEFNPLDNALVLNSLLLTEVNLKEFVSIINKFKPEFLHVYPSVASLFANLLMKDRIRIDCKIKAILCGSENIYSWQREVLEEVFECRVFSWYGHTEKAVLAGGCERSNNYHFSPEYGFTEFDSLNSVFDQTKEIIATGFNNYVMPFIRYKTEDYCIPYEAKCNCGRNHLLMQRVEGREQEYIVTKDGDKIALGPILFGMHDKELSLIKQFQIVQETRGNLIIKIIPMGVITETVGNKIFELFKPRFKNKFDYKVEYVEHIQKTSSGKYKYLIKADRI